MFVTILDALPDRTGLDRLWHLLPQARLVGGSVRDLLRGVAVNDLDLATPEPPEIVQKILQDADIKVVPTGLSHGTLTAVIDRRPYEVTTLRRDDRTDGRRAVVSWTQDWREDASRRDFTINAMSCDSQGQIHDFFGGQEDLHAHRVRFVGDPARRITEDALRILRFFRFDARFGTETPDLEAMTAIRSKAALVETLSAERVASELLRILIGPRLLQNLAHMREADILSRLLPQAHEHRLARLLACQAPHDALLRLGALSDEENLAQRLRLSNKQAERLASMRIPMPELLPAAPDDDLRRARADLPLESLLDRTWLRQADKLGAPDPSWNALRNRLEKLPRPVFPLAGRDALQCGAPPGPQIGAALKQVQGWWRAEGCRPDRNACLARLKQALGLSPNDAER
ncbi:poly(A) polymerase [Kozakia baliensis]|uniref:Poly(A) polymerase n=1 Tax=Kozakia baliensis TaxID=153496 RepID=A0A1D8UUR3_9PROT|nr:poly(A) polymerase [Kozakia baliensis]